MVRLIDLPLTLDRLRETHLPVTLEWRNQSREWFNDSNVITWDYHLAWFRDLGTDEWMFVIESKGEPVAQFGLYDITTKGAQFGRLLVASSRRGEGFGRFAIEQALGLARGLPRIYLEVKAGNLPALTLYRSVGFTVTGDHDGAIHMEKTL